MSDKEATKKLVEFYHLESLVKYGKTKIFIRTPKTVYYLEEQREAKMHSIVSALLDYVYTLDQLDKPIQVLPPLVPHVCRSQ